MDTTVLLEKLVDIERFIGVAPDSAIRRKVIDIEDCVIAMEQKNARTRQGRVPAAQDEAALRPADRASVLPMHPRCAKPFLAWSNPSTRDPDPNPPICA